MVVVHFLWAFGWLWLFLEASRWLLGWLLLFLGGMWMLVAGHNRNVHAKSAKTDTWKMALDLQMPWHNWAHVCCTKLCQSKFRLFLNAPSPGMPEMGSHPHTHTHTHTHTHDICNTQGLKPQEVAAPQWGCGLR